MGTAQKQQDQRSLPCMSRCLMRMTSRKKEENSPARETPSLGATTYLGLVGKVSPARLPLAVGASHLFDRDDAGEGPQVGVRDPRVLLLDRLEEPARVFEAGAGGRVFLSVSSLRRIVQSPSCDPWRGSVRGDQDETRQRTGLTLPGRHLLPRTCDSSHQRGQYNVPVSTKASEYMRPDHGPSFATSPGPAPGFSRAGSRPAVDKAR